MYTGNKNKEKIKNNTTKCGGDETQINKPRK